MNIQQIDLLREQYRQHYGQCGDVVHIVSGTLCLVNAAPYWLGGQMRMETCLLLAGSVYVLPRTGWYSLQARSDVRMTVRSSECRPVLLRRYRFRDAVVSWLGKCAVRG